MHMRHFLVVAVLALAACSKAPVTTTNTGPVSGLDTYNLTNPVPGATDTSTVAYNGNDPGLPSDWKKGPFMEIYVRGYADSNGDGMGDIQGVISKLDYLQSLGIKGIWLMPITRSQDRNHGYAVTDYRSVEPDYGTVADVDALLAAAHSRGIGVILDYVMNHSAKQHPLFTQSSVAGSAVRDWYVWSGTKPTGWNIYGSDPWYSAGGSYYFAGFWDQMPDWNLSNVTVTQWHMDNMRYWLNRGVDGFRFDAVGNLVENGPNAWEDQPQDITIMANVRDQIAMEYPNRYIVCEMPARPAAFVSACGSAFAFGDQNNLVRLVNSTGTEFTSARDQTLVSADPGRYVSGTPATFLSNHDGFAGNRIMTQVNGNVDKAKFLASLLLLRPGIPFVYYGEEVGMMNGAGLTGDPALRNPMSWTGDVTNAGFTTAANPFRSFASNVASFNAASSPMGTVYKDLIAYRAANPGLVAGQTPVAVNNTTALAWISNDEHHVLLANPTNAAVTVTATLPASLYGATLDGVVVGNDGSYVVTLGAYEVKAVK